MINLSDVPQSRLEFLKWERPDKLLQLVSHPDLLVKDLVDTARAVGRLQNQIEDPERLLDAETSAIEQEAPLPDENLSRQLDRRHGKLFKTALAKADSLLHGEPS